MLISRIVKIVLMLMFLSKLALGLHCWKEHSGCGNPNVIKYNSKCDVEELRIQDLQVFKGCLYSFCEDNSFLEFRIRPQDVKTQKPSEVACSGNRYSRHAAIFNKILAACIIARYPELSQGRTVICCQKGLTQGCA